MEMKKSFCQLFWQLWKDVLVLLATLAILVYITGAFFPGLDAATMSKLVQVYQVVGAITFMGIMALCAVMTLGRWLFSRCAQRQPRADK